MQTTTSATRTIGRTLAGLALGLLLGGVTRAGVGGKTFEVELRIRSLGNCTAARIDFQGTDVTLRECNSFDGTFKELDLFFFGFWSFEGLATQAETGLEGPVIGSGVHVFGERIHGSGVYQGFDFKLTGFRLADVPPVSPLLPVHAPPPQDGCPGDPHRSPARL